MSCKVMNSEIHEVQGNLCQNMAGIKTVYILNVSDIKIVNGEVKIKRKYGKFKRPVLKYPNS